MPIRTSHLTREQVEILGAAQDVALVDRDLARAENPHLKEHFGFVSAALIDVTRLPQTASLSDADLHLRPDVEEWCRSNIGPYRLVTYRVSYSLPVDVRRQNIRDIWLAFGTEALAHLS